MDLVECRGCAQPVVAHSSRCWRCGRPVLHAVQPEPTGLGTLAQATVIGSVFVMVLLGMVVFTQRQHAVDEFAAASERAAAVEDLEEREEAEAARRAAQAVARATPTPTPGPPPDAAGPDTYTVQAGDSLFSVAADIGLSPNELISWNKDTHPTLQSTPALKSGWVLRTTGPPLGTPIPQPTPQPRPPPTPQPQPATPEPQVAGPGTPTLPAFGPGSFPASEAVTVSHYAVSGGTPQEIHASKDANGPWSDWLGRRASAHVEVSPSFNFRFQGDGFGGCSVISTDPSPMSVSYHVVLPAWTPPAGVPSRTVDWWIETIHQTVAHEGHHITLYESYLPAMNEAVATGTCASVELALEQLWADASRANCEFDLAEYGYSVGLTMESCLAN